MGINTGNDGSIFDRVDFSGVQEKEGEVSKFDIVAETCARLAPLVFPLVALLTVAILYLFPWRKRPRDRN